MCIVKPEPMVVVLWEVAAAAVEVATRTIDHLNGRHNRVASVACMRPWSEEVEGVVRLSVDIKTETGILNTSTMNGTDRQTDTRIYENLLKIERERIRIQYVLHLAFFFSSSSSLFFFDFTGIMTIIIIILDQHISNANSKIVIGTINQNATMIDQDMVIAIRPMTIGEFNRLLDTARSVPK